MTLIYAIKMRMHRHARRASARTERGEYLNITAVRRNYPYAPIASEHYLTCSNNYRRRRDVVATLDALLGPPIIGNFRQYEVLSNDKKILYSSP